MEMDRKYIIIALVAVILALVAGIGYMLFFNVEYQTIALSNGTTIEVPKADDSNWTVDSYGIRMYTAPSKKTVLTSLNSAEDFSLIGAMGFAMARDALMNGSTSAESYNGYDIRENTVNGTHYYMVYISNNETHDNIFMGSGDLNILKHMIDSIKFGDPAAVENANGMSSPTVVSSNTPIDQYSEEDLMAAAESGYYYGYLSGYGDSYYDNYNYYDDYDDYDYQSSSSSSSSSSSGGQSSSDDYDYDDYDDYDYDSGESESADYE